MKQLVKIGNNTILFLGELLKKFSPEKIFLVTGKQSYESCGAEKILSNLLKEYNYFQFCDFFPNPKLESIEHEIKLFKENNYDFIIAVGGGSVIDVAKSINILQAQPTSSYEKTIINNNFVNNGVPLVAIPTTSGTGSEATHFAVIYIKGVKYSISSEKILPNVAIIDPQFTYSLPYKIAIDTGLDAFAQAIESFWSINSTSESEEYAAKAIHILWNNLPKLRKTYLFNIKDDISYAAHLAGRAINITKTTAPHAFSYAVTTQFGLTHGHAVALFLPYFFEYNFNVTENSCNDPRGVDFVKAKIMEIAEFLKIDSSSKLSNSLFNFIKSLSVENDFKKLGIDDNDLKSILEKPNAARLKNNPRKFIFKDFWKIIKQQEG